MTIKQIITPREKDLGDFSVRRVLPYAKQKMVGPWIFFDHMGPAQFKPGQGVNVRPHPHINLATVTYLFAGEILHRDSLGSEQCIRPGDINLMVAGSGITHSERETAEVNAAHHELHGLQLWHALPQADEETAPAFYHYAAADLPDFVLHGVPVRVMMGNAYGFSSPVRTFAETLYLEAHLQAGDSLQAPQAEELAVYVVSGSIQIAGQKVSQFSMAVLEPGATPTITADTDSRIAMIGGATMSARYIEWNFVSSRKQRIEQAKHDWQTGKFAKVVGDTEEFIPLPD